MCSCCPRALEQRRRTNAVPAAMELLVCVSTETASAVMDVMRFDGMTWRLLCGAPSPLWDFQHSFPAAVCYGCFSSKEISDWKLSSQGRRAETEGDVSVVMLYKLTSCLWFISIHLKSSSSTNSDLNPKSLHCSDVSSRATNSKNRLLAPQEHHTCPVTALLKLWSTLLSQRPQVHLQNTDTVHDSAADVLHLI